MKAVSTCNTWLLHPPVPQDLDDPQTQCGVIQWAWQTKSTMKAKGEAIELLKDPLLIAQIKALEPFSTEADALLEVLIDYRMMADSPISAAFKDLQQRLQVAKQQAQAKSTLASHREKRKFSIHDILASQQEDSVGSPHYPRIWWCYRHPETSVPVCHCQVLADARSCIAEDAIINAENGYETVGSELVIILACDARANLECGPYKFIMSQDYSVSAHRDDCFTEFCLSWTVDCKVDPPKSAQEAAVPAMTSVTTHQQSRQFHLVSGGANFVDVALKVKVEMAVGTLIAFRPKNLYSTTRLCGAHIHASMRCFASRIKVAFEKAQQGLSVELHTGAGKGGEYIKTNICLEMPTKV
ncbi:hypothetical protein DFH08DRAFT_826378 [Mycena albidolilacea]|uniref:Uncharacterized protein n=1 Tax=Mycena albidolilacea TaxID=1033008 RepID=A0AAD6Z0H9_9AGAR|nr:hypothetical protein DFH08DRAFT_826378 [Mycena albidolilacea]